MSRCVRAVMHRFAQLKPRVPASTDVTTAPPYLMDCALALGNCATCSATSRKGQAGGPSPTKPASSHGPFLPTASQISDSAYTPHSPCRVYERAHIHHNAARVKISGLGQVKQAMQTTLAPAAGSSLAAKYTSHSSSTRRRQRGRMHTSTTSSYAVSPPTKTEGRQRRPRNTGSSSATASSPSASSASVRSVAAFSIH